jgi:hypothetical protein
VTEAPATGFQLAYALIASIGRGMAVAFLLAGFIARLDTFLLVSIAAGVVAINCEMKAR